MKIKEKKKKAISLIVLVITILVLSILAATVIVSISNTNVIEEANKTVFKADMSNYKEVYEMYITKKELKDVTFDKDSLNLKSGDQEFNEIFGEVADKYKENFAILEGELAYLTEKESEIEILNALGIRSSDAISRTKSYVGYYADVDGDGEVEGIIYSDSQSSDTKDYVISQSSYTVEGAPGFKEYPVIKVKDGQESGTDRFYVWALEDTKGGTWYANAFGKEVDTTKWPSGSGKEKTKGWVEIGNAGTYGALSGGDIWSAIQNTDSKYSYSNGWFVPDAFRQIADCLKLHDIGNASYNSSLYYEEYGLWYYYWTSTAGWHDGTIYTAYLGDVATGSLVQIGVGRQSFPSNYPSALRLATTF